MVVLRTRVVVALVLVVVALVAGLSVYLYASRTSTNTGPIEEAILSEEAIVSRYCPVYGVSVEARLYARIHTDRELLGRIALVLEEKYVKAYLEANVPVPSETLELLEVLRDESRDVALLEVIVEVRNRGFRHLAIYGGRGCGYHILDYAARSVTGVKSDFSFSRVKVEVLNGKVYTGESVECLLILLRRNLLPLSSIREVRYYLIERPQGGVFKANVEAFIKGFTDSLCYNPSPGDPCNCILTLQVTWSGFPRGKYL